MCTEAPADKPFVWDVGQDQASIPTAGGARTFPIGHFLTCNLRRQQAHVFLDLIAERVE